MKLLIGTPKLNPKHVARFLRVLSACVCVSFYMCVCVSLYVCFTVTLSARGYRAKDIRIENFGFDLCWV